MKRIIRYTALALLALLTFTACEATPSSTVTVGTDDEKTLDFGNVSTGYARLDTPEMLALEALPACPLSVWFGENEAWNGEGSYTGQITSLLTKGSLDDFHNNENFRWKIGFHFVDLNCSVLQSSLDSEETIPVYSVPNPNIPDYRTK